MKTELHGLVTAADRRPCWDCASETGTILKAKVQECMSTAYEDLSQKPSNGTGNVPWENGTYHGWDYNK